MGVAPDDFFLFFVFCLVFLLLVCPIAKTATRLNLFDFSTF